MKRTTIFTAVFGLVAFGFAAYGLIGDVAVPASPAAQGRLDKSENGKLDKSENGRLGAGVL